MTVCDISERYVPHGRGYIKVYRKLLSSAVFHDEGTLKVWMWCLLRANYDPVPLDFAGEEISIQPGQFVTGRFSAARELNMTDSRVYRLLKKLESWNNISINSNNKFSIITIVNYKEYQYSDSPVEQPANNQRTTSEQPANNQRTQIKKLRNQEERYMPDFDSIWDLYPKRQGKKSAISHFNASVKTPEDYENIKIALSNYLKSPNPKNGNLQYIQNGSTWFNNWQDWINPSEAMMKGNSNGTSSNRSNSTNNPETNGRPKVEPGKFDNVGV
jgi:hypothetical protein